MMSIKALARHGRSTTVDLQLNGQFRFLSSATLILPVIRPGCIGRQPTFNVWQMAIAKRAECEHVQYHRDGSVWAKGQTLGGLACGYWEWFRKDGTKMRSGCFENGVQVGDWTTYDKHGNVYKVTKKKL